MPLLPPKKVPPPPKEPGTHTNAEVREALHARALRRTVIVTALIFLLIACLAVVSSTAQEYEGPEDTTSQPKMVMIVADGLTPDIMENSLRSNKAPFTRLLNSSGGIYGYLSTPAGTGSPLVRLLTGTANTASATLSGATSFLGVLKKYGKKPVVLAPTSYWSSNQIGSGTACTHVGLFDSECNGTECPADNENAYCNAFYKIIACDGSAELYREDIIKAFQKTVEISADILYVQLSNFMKEESASVNYSSVLQLYSEMNLIDGAMGQLVLSLAERTRATTENWLIVVTGSGARATQTPMVMAAYSRGQLLQLNDLGRASTTDIYNTVLRWFGVSTAEDNLIGICTDGIHAANCKTTE